MTYLSEILFAKPEQRGAVEFRVAAHVVIRVRMQLLAIHVAPHLFGVVFGIDVHSLRIPVVFFAGDVVAAFQNQNPLT